MVETLDVFPTLCEVAGLPKPGFVDGVSLMPILRNPKAAGHAALAYRGNAQTIRTDTHRLIAHKSGHMELCDHTTKAGETLNVADQNPDLVKQLRARIKSRLGK